MTESNPFNRTVILTVAMASSFFNPFMGAAVNVALPEISGQFSLNAVALSWIAMSFLLASAIFMVPLGRLADLTGRKKIFLIGNIVLTLGSVLCALSQTGSMLIAFRFLQGIGSAMIFSSGMAMVISAYPPQNRGKVIGLNVSAVYIGLSAAPALGGFMTEAWGWESLFYMNAIAGVFIILGVVGFVKTEWSDKSAGKFDVFGTVLYMVSMTLIMYGFSQLPDKNAIVMLVAGILVFGFFIWVELRHAYPVLEINLFIKNRIFAFSNLAALINYAATFAVTFIMSLFLQYVIGFSPSKAGFVLVAQPVMMAFVASFSGRMSDKYDPRILSSLGMGIIVVGLVMLTFLTPSIDMPYVVGSLLILGMGFGLFSSPNTNSVMGSVAKKDLGIASATISTMRLTGQMVSMATAAMVINVFIGDEKINQQNIPAFMQSTKVLFVIFAVLCFLGVFASLARGKTERG
jgi:EmrB/QacA subfamily drug resistance transporter